MPRKKSKKKAKQIVVTKEKLQKIQEAKKQVVEQAKVVKQEVKQEVKTTDFCDMLGKPLFVGDNVFNKDVDVSSILSNTYSIYLSGFNRFIFAVWTIDIKIQEASAPFSVLENKEFFLKITKGFIPLSAKLFVIGIWPSSKNVLKPSSIFIE